MIHVIERVHADESHSRKMIVGNTNRGFAHFAIFTNTIGYLIMLNYIAQRSLLCMYCVTIFPLLVQVSQDTSYGEQNIPRSYII